MKKPTKAEFGYTRETGWQDERDIDLYYNALKAFENRPKGIGGRPTTNPIHESWNEIFKLFDSSSFYRSRRAFCRWADIHYATFSAMQRRPLKKETESQIKRWHWIGDGQGLDGSMNTNADLVKKEVQNG